MLIRRHENIAWLTGGAVEVRVLTPGETGVASLLVTAKGKRYYFTTENEAPRLHDEEFGALDFEPVLFPWYADDTKEAAQRLAGVELGSDTPIPGLIPVNLYPLRASLSEAEIARYRWLGAETADATVESLHQVEPGLSEYDLEAITAANLLRRGILPSVYLFAVDDRIFKYKHAAARGKRLKNYAMLNLCSRKWGLAISITRFVHFGALPDGSGRTIHSRQPQSTPRSLDATQIGATSAQLFRVAQARLRRRRISGRRAIPSPGRSHRVRRARMGRYARRHADRRQSSGICMEPQHPRRQGRRHGDSARRPDRVAHLDAGAARHRSAREWKSVSGGGSAGEVKPGLGVRG